MKLDRTFLAAAVVIPLAAALLWAAYYIFVLAITPGTEPSAVYVYPFLFGGAGYTVWSVAEGHGRAVVAMWRQPSSYLRVAFLSGSQLSILASTYLAGPVDTALLSLLGDVVLTPIVAGIWFSSYRARVDSPILWLGMALCTVGGGLAIVGNHGLTALQGVGYVLLVSIPVTVALYFVGVARELERTPPSAVASQSMLAAGLVGLAILPWLPGGLPGLAVVDPIPWLILVATGVTSFFVAPALYFEAIRRVGLVVPPMMMTGIPVFAALLAWALLGIAIPWIGILGIPVAITGAILALRGETSTG